MKINAKGLHYKDLNEKIYHLVKNGIKEITLDNVNGQRYIGAGLTGNVKITINGLPGNDLGTFMDGPEIIVNSNAQDGVGNTMNSGKIIVYGNTGDITGHSMRGGTIYIKGYVGYRVGIHMKAYRNSYPVIIIGDSAGDFLGEYMAGGIIIVLSNKIGNYIGTGMHGGKIYIQGDIKKHQISKEIKSFKPNPHEIKEIEKYIRDYCQFFNIKKEKIIKGKFTKLVPYTHRPYGNLYAY